MKKINALINFKFQFDPSHKGAHYTLDGIRYMNNGDFAEIADKAVRGYDLVKDANTAYDLDSDIPQIHTSVKSGKATLVNKILGNDFQEVKKAYFQTVASTAWDWVVILDDTVSIYHMNKTEFSEFMDKWSSFDRERKVIRFKATSTKMLKWLEERI